MLISKQINVSIEKMYVPSPCSGAFVVHRRIRQRTPSTTTNGGKISTVRGQMAGSAVVTKQLKRKGLQSVVTTVNICYKITVVDCLLTFYVCTDIYYCVLPIIYFMLLNKKATCLSPDCQHFGSSTFSVLKLLDSKNSKT